MPESRRPAAAPADAGAQRLLVAGAVLLAALAAVPVLAVVLRGFAPGAGPTWAHLADTVLARYAGHTLALVALVGAGVAFGGTLAGWVVAQFRFPGRGFFAWGLMLPLAMPAYVMAYAYTDALEVAGPLQSWLRAATGWSLGDYWFPDIRSLPGAALMFVFTLYPYVYLLARNAFAERPPAFVEAARTLGASRRDVFLRVDLPLARPAIAAGVALALMETLADFGTVSYFAVDTLTTGVYRAWFQLGDRTASSQLATLLLAFVLAAILLERVSRGAARSFGSGRTKAALADARPRLRGARAAAAFALCALPIMLGFLLPLALLLRLVAGDPEVAFSPRFAEWAWNSLRVSAIAAVLAVAFALLVAYAARLAPGRLPRIAARALGLGYAVPGTVLAVGVLLPLGFLDARIIDAARALGLPNPGLLFTGSVVALVYAYLVRYFAVAWNGVEPAFARITPAMDAAARSLGATAAGTFRRVHAPMLSGSVATAALLVFVDVMKELPATLLMRPFNFDTLATQAFQLARDERLAEAALPSIAIVVVGLVPLVALARAGSRVRRSTRAALAPVPSGADAPG